MSEFCDDSEENAENDYDYPDNEQGSDYDYNEDMGFSTPKLAREISDSHFDIPVDSYRIVHIGEVCPQMEKYICELSTILGVGRDNAELILQKNKWNIESTTEKFFNNPDATCAAAGINTTTSLTRPENSSSSCGICLSEVDILELFGMSCGHKFCRYSILHRYVINNLLNFFQLVLGNAMVAILNLLSVMVPHALILRVQASSVLFDYPVQCWKRYVEKK